MINTSSMSGVVVNTPQCQAAYNVSKAGATAMLTKSLAFEWAKHNVRVNTIAPGYMETEMIDQFPRAAQGEDRPLGTARLVA